jgi:hypothetical protein
MKQSYKEFKNLIHNELQISREDIKEMIQTAVDNEVHRVMNDSSELIDRVISNTVYREIIGALQGTRKGHNLGESLEAKVRRELVDSIKSLLLNKVEINLNIKMKPEQEVN